MVNVSKVFRVLAKFEGTAAGRVTVKGKQLTALVEKAGVPEEKAKKLLNAFHKPSVNLAYNAQKGGLKATATLKEGKTVIGKGEATLKGIGTESVSINLAGTLGKNGELAEFKEVMDLAKPYDVSKTGMRLDINDGILQAESHVGEFMQQNIRLDARSTMDKILNKLPAAEREAAIKEGLNYDSIIAEANKIGQEYIQKIKDFLTGKTPTLKPIKKVNLDDKINVAEINQECKKFVAEMSRKNLKTEAVRELSKDLEGFVNKVNAGTGKRSYVEAIEKQIDWKKASVSDEFQELCKKLKKS